MIRVGDYNLRYCNSDDLIEVGLDEAGRGTLFGRIYAGAVILSNDPDGAFFDHGAGLKDIKDSKKISKRKREILYDYVRECAVDWSVGWAEAAEIDATNILQADMLAMHRALDKLVAEPQRCLVDGDCWKPWRDSEHVTIVDGDASYLPIACASIIAKVEHDMWIKDIVATHPDWDEKYGFLSNQGYGTKRHMEGLKTHGATEEHRKTFAPVRNVILFD